MKIKLILLSLLATSASFGQITVGLVSSSASIYEFTQTDIYSDLDVRATLTNNSPTDIFLYKAGNYTPNDSTAPLSNRGVVFSFLDPTGYVPATLGTGWSFQEISGGVFANGNYVRINQGTSFTWELDTLTHWANSDFYKMEVQGLFYAETFSGNTPQYLDLRANNLETDFVFTPGRQSVPEPTSTGLLFVAGLFGLCSRRRNPICA